MNYAHSDNRERWHAHPLLGDPSFDAFEAYIDNPVHTGIGVWEWPVNGFLFLDPVSGSRYIYVSLYAKGYAQLGVVTLMRSTDDGASWRDVGPVFDGRGLAERYSPQDASLGTLDVSVVYEDGVYHMVYGWGSLKEEQGGIAYASAQRPEGPFLKAAHPLRNEIDDKLLHGLYKRTYASTLIRRENDWLIVSMMSMSRNTGGSWALVAMTADRPDGPYGEPVFLLYPQSLIYHPAPLEFYPAFVYDGYLYAPSTSVGSNRTYQAVFRAQLEKAHLDKAWALHQEGSCWHSRPLSYERYGIWGQTYSGQVDEDGMLNVMYPALNYRGEGTINVASRPWATPYRELGFVLSANNAPAFSFVRDGYETFTLRSDIVACGSFTIVWGWSGPVGATIMPRWADGEPDPLVYTDGIGVALRGGMVSIAETGADGELRIVACEAGAEPCWAKADPHDYGERQPFEVPVRFAIEIVQGPDGGTVVVNDREFAYGRAANAGRIGLIADAGSIVECSSFEIDGVVGELWIALLPSEGLAGSAQSPERWERELSPAYTFGYGYRSVQRKGFAEETDHMLKWNFKGDAFRLSMPAAQEPCRAAVYLDGVRLEDLVLAPSEMEEDQGPRIVLEREGLEDGRHALVLLLKDGELRCDSLSYRTSRGPTK